MKRFSFLVLCMIVVFASCVSLNDREISVDERASVQVIGSVTVDFTSFQFFHLPGSRSIKNRAYSELMKAAQARYDGHVEIRKACYP